MQFSRTQSRTSPCCSDDACVSLKRTQPSDCCIGGRNRNLRSRFSRILEGQTQHRHCSHQIRCLIISLVSHNHHVSIWFFRSYYLQMSSQTELPPRVSLSLIRTSISFYARRFREKKFVSCFYACKHFFVASFCHHACGAVSDRSKFEAFRAHSLDLRNRDAFRLAWCFLWLENIQVVCCLSCFDFSTSERYFGENRCFRWRKGPRQKDRSLHSIHNC